MRDNKKYFIAYSLLKKSFPIWFVYLLFLLSKDLNYTEAILLDSFAAAMSLIFEVPSGIIADRFNRKKILIIGEMIIMLNFIILYFSNNYMLFILGALLSGLGDSLVSGTGEALIYDSFKEQNEIEKFLEFTADINKWGFITVAIVTLLSSYIFDLSNELPMLITIIMQIGCLFCICNMSEPNISRERNLKKLNFIDEIKQQKKIIKKIVATEGLVEIFIIYVLMVEIISNINYSTQAYLPYLGLDVKYLGGIMFLFNIASAIGAKMAKKINVNRKIWVALYAVILLVLSYKNIYIVIGVLFCSRFINGFVWPVISNETNKRIESEERATILSYQSLFSSIMPLLIDPIIGLGFDNYGISKTYFVMGIIAMIIYIVWILKTKITLETR